MDQKRRRQRYKREGGRGGGRGRRRFHPGRNEFGRGNTANERSFQTRGGGGRAYTRAGAAGTTESRYIGNRRETNFLSDLAELDPYDALHKLASRKGMVLGLLRKRNLQFNLMTQLTRVVANICQCSQSSETFLDVIGTLQREGLMKHLSTHITDWPDMVVQNNSYRGIVSQLLLPVITILFPLLLNVPYDDAYETLCHFDQSISECKEEGVIFPHESLRQWDALFDHIENEKKRAPFTGDSRRNYGRSSLLGKGFRQYSIFPMENELNVNCRPSLSVNIVDGGYNNVEHYLDVQFRLLREDLIKPLRDGISKYRSAQASQGEKLIKLQDIYVYQDVQVLEAKASRDGISYLTKFNVQHLKRIQWENSKRLIYGSLLCLSPDQFETIIFAVVSNSQARDLRRGLVELKFHEIHEVLSTLCSKTLTMVESPAYFEAYRHVLKRLQMTNETNFPLQRYIVKAVPNVSLPLYLRKNPYARYDLTGVSHHQRVLKVYVAKTWPSIDYFDFDRSQFEAFKAALTEELCLIQGPPGTGKTYIGLKIVDTLLRNIDVWSPVDDPSPILLICFTNHALDQFLEGVLAFLPDEGIIRIGGRSSSEKLKEFNLNEIRKRRSRPKSRRKYTKTIRDEMTKLENRIQAIQRATRSTRVKILPEGELKEVIAHWHYYSLMTGFSSECREPPKTGEFLTHWLQAVVDEDKPLHDDIAPPIEVEITAKFGVRKKGETQYVLQGRKLKEYIKKNLTLKTGYISHEIIGTNNVWSLSLTDRWRLYRHWLKGHQQCLQRLLRIASNSLLKENVLIPFISTEHWQNLRSSQEVRHAKDGQSLVSFLGVTNGIIPKLLRMTGKTVSFTELEELGAKIKSLNIQEEDSFVAEVQYPLRVYIAKVLTEINAMSKHETQNIRDVYQLSYHDRWRLYKYWISKYSNVLQERLTVSRGRILKEDCLKAQMTSIQYLNLTDPLKHDIFGKVDRGQLLILLLRAYNGVPVADVQEVLWDCSQESDRIEVKGAAQLLAEARYIEDDDEGEFFHEHLKELSDYSSDEEEDARDGIFGATSIPHDDKWNTTTRNVKSVKAYIIQHMRENDVLTKETAARVYNVWKLKLSDRWKLYRYWISLYNKHLQQSLLPLYEEYEKQVKLLNEVREQEDVEIVREAKVIALTTTGAAKYHSLIERVHPKIVIVEEAAEVLEAHIVTSLTKKCEHLILIGDHQQLRPNPTVYELSTRYGLDISLFERLIKNHFPRHRLNLQHRMRPEISRLLKIHEDFYPGLQDHESVYHYYDIQGVVKNVFFLDHAFQESKQYDNHSKSNRFEAEFLTSLCRYLLQQDYKPEQITVLTAYTGQLGNFQRLMPKSEFKNLRVCPVDSYQGEENDIILLSLVRSNEVGSIGFLKTANRVCVALSRAKKGLYCVGNFSLLSSENDLWKVISSTLQTKGSLGKSMKLVCANHPHIVTEVRVADDFKAMPEGGCSRPCQSLLNCGHFCPLSCHPRDKDHKSFKCRKRCRKPICDLNHECGRFCFEKCQSQCNRKVFKELACGHRTLVACFERNSKKIQCQESCQLLLDCGHLCKKKCSEDCTTVCPEMVTKRLQCGHSTLTVCGNKEIECRGKCNELLNCGHRCRGTCRECRGGRLHVECDQPCRRILICGHGCSSVCSSYCPPCEEKCENRCAHGKCEKQCGQLCTPCHRFCGMTCIHRVCMQPCWKPCEVTPCNKPCSRTAKCGHECIGLCGEKCPAKCLMCNKTDETKPATVKNKDDFARFVQLEDCEHLIDVDVLEKSLVEQSKYYSVIQTRGCPTCGKPIRKCSRYMHLLKQSKLDVEEVKKQIIENEGKIQKVREEVTQKLRNVAASARDIVTLPTYFYCGRMGRQITTKEFSNTAKTLLYNMHRQVNGVSVSMVQIACLDYKVEMFKQLCDLKRKANNINDSERNDMLKKRIESTLLELIQFLDSLSKVSSQTLEDWEFSLKRISVLFKLTKTLGCVSLRDDSPDKDVLQKIYKIVSEESKFSLSKQFTVTKLFLGLTSFDVFSFEEEAKLEVHMIGWASGRWLKCRKDHIYSTLPGAKLWEKMECPQCKHGVSGHHQLEAVNRLTNVMTRWTIGGKKH